ncbi:MAG: PQQ-dependent sugar dehydrogenase, partial [Acidobacteria bacterium]|nr:PQQ-dependent sugar dehydrogenase [Acidobacteriota bacterium]
RSIVACHRAVFVAAEGVLTVDGTPTSTTPWVEGTQIVTVSDGKLTVNNALGASNNKLCFIDISSTTTGGNSSPATPTITAPSSDGQIVHPADIHMETSPNFSDPNPGDTHVCTDWEIWTISPAERVWVASCIGGPQKYHSHIGDGLFVNSYAGRTEFMYDTDYRLRARFKDSSGDPATEWSAWAERRFRTASQPAPGGAITWTVKQPGYQVEVFATGFELPVNIAFKPNPGPNPTDVYFYVTELYGQIKVVRRDGTVSDYIRGVLNYRPSGIFPGSGEQGLAGIVVDPASGDVFASMLYDPEGNVDGPKYPKVMRFRSNENGTVAGNYTTILDMVGEDMYESHQISNLSIGPDGKLYVHMGDGFDASTAQNLDLFRGKILRVNLDGSAPTDNPFYNASDGINARDYVYAYGFRNPFGGIWRAADNFHYTVENGPSVDRFAKVVRGRNYLWDGSDASMRNYAIYNWSPATAPVNIAFIQSSTFGGSGFPAGKMDHAFVSESGPTWATGPQGIYGKRMSSCQELWK